tara:strand:- start:187 stop:861 length:675 start_codon:yes stop_codon:yes gene_type:complete
LLNKSYKLKENRGLKTKKSNIDFNCDYPIQLTEIFKKNKNIAIWNRKLTNQLIKSGESIINTNPNLEFSKIVHTSSLEKILLSEFGSNNKIKFFIDDVCILVNYFCNLFKIEKVWLRLDGINRPMCPNFHTDDVKCRMVTTYVGPGTQWIPKNLINKNIKESDIMQLNFGDVALLKGEGWHNNKGNGIVHRSPHQNTKYNRLYMTVDFVDFYNYIYRNRLYKNF